MKRTLALRPFAKLTKEHPNSEHRVHQKLKFANGNPSRNSELFKITTHITLTFFILFNSIPSAFSDVNKD